MTHSITAAQELRQMIVVVVANIPFGKVASYGQIAVMAGLPRHARLVGRVLSELDSDSDLPWHRVVNAQGQIRVQRIDAVGMNEQQARLLAEGVMIKNGKVNLKRDLWTI